MSTKPPPNIHPNQRLVTPDGDAVDIDVELVPVVQRLWDLGLTTSASCQDLGEATQGLRELNPQPPCYGGDAFVGFTRGYAFLKFPVADAKKLLNTLLGTSFRNRVSLRWQSGSWRMNVPLVCEEQGGIDLSSFAQIYFPRGQISELTHVLTAACGTSLVC